MTRCGRLAEAKVPVAFHLGDSGYLTYSAAWGGQAEFEPFRASDPLDSVLVDDRAIYDTMASMIVHGVFTRHPTLRVASIENGSDWVALLAKRLRKKANQVPQAFREDPLEVLRRNVWVTPYYEEDLHALAATIGVEHVLFGSDWPHGEGLAEPLQFTKELTGFDDADVRKIMRDNVIELLGQPRLPTDRATDCPTASPADTANGATTTCRPSPGHTTASSTFTSATRNSRSGCSA